MTESGREPSKWYCSFSDPSPRYSTTMQPHEFPHPGKYLRLYPLQHNRCKPRQRNMAQMKEQIKTPEKELSNEGIANLLDAEFKTLVIRILTEMVLTVQT